MFQKFRSGKEYVTPEHVEKLEKYLVEEALPVFNNNLKFREPLVHLAALGFSHSVWLETGSEFIARRAEKALLQAMRVKDWNWKLRLRAWWYRSWRWLKVKCGVEQTSTPEEREKMKLMWKTEMKEMKAKLDDEQE